MKILNIIQCSNLGGMEQSTLESLSALKESGHDVAMVSLRPIGALQPLARQKGIKIKEIGTYRFAGLGNICELKRIIHRYAPDRILLTGHNFGSLIAATLTKIPTYLSIHFHHSEHHILFWRIFYALAKKSCERIRFISQYIYDEVAHIFRNYDKVECFPNIFREPTAVCATKKAREALELPIDDFIIGNAGWLIPRKAFDVFLRTAALIIQNLPKSFFLIAGDGPERDHLEKMACELGLSDKILFLGWQQDLSLFYCSIDVLLFNTHFDALGRTPVEAMCYGVPVVASVTSGGLNEFIRNGQDGYLIDQHEPSKLADEIIRLHNDKRYRELRAQNGRNRVLELGSPERHRERLEQFMQLK